MDSATGGTGMHRFPKRMLGCLAVTGALALSLAPAAYAAGEPGGGPLQ